MPITNKISFQLLLGKLSFSSSLLSVILLGMHIPKKSVDVSPPFLLRFPLSFR